MHSPQILASFLGIALCFAFVSPSSVDARKLTKKASKASKKTTLLSFESITRADNIHWTAGIDFLEGNLTMIGGTMTAMYLNYDSFTVNAFNYASLSNSSAIGESQLACTVTNGAPAVPNTAICDIVSCFGTDDCLFGKASGLVDDSGNSIGIVLGGIGEYAFVTGGSFVTARQRFGDCTTSIDCYSFFETTATLLG
eukprot:jgi/Psemu1/18375/gm1.18375_g